MRSFGDVMTAPCELWVKIYPIWRFFRESPPRRPVKCLWKRGGIISWRTGCLVPKGHRRSPTGRQKNSFPYFILRVALVSLSHGNNIIHRYTYITRVNIQGKSLTSEFWNFSGFEKILRSEWEVYVGFSIRFYNSNGQREVLYASRRDKG